MANVVNDTFTDTTGTTLASHTGETGATWTKGSNANNNGSIQVSASNTIRPSAITTNCSYTASGTPASANYVVTGVVSIKTTRTGDQIGVVGRYDAAADTGYLLVAITGAGGGWLLGRRANGVFTQFGSTFSATIADGDTYVLSMIGTTISAIINGTTRLTQTDSTYTAVGKGGVQMYAGGGAPGDTVGAHVTSLTVVDSTGVVTVAAADLFDNAMDGTGTPRQSALSRLVISTDATKLIVNGTTDSFGNITPATELGLIVDGVVQTSMPFAANGTADVFTSGLSVSTKTLEVVVAGQNWVTTPTNVLGTYINSFTLQGHTSYSVQTPTVGTRTVVIGDSISNGFSASPIETNGWVSVLRRAPYNRRTLNYGWGSLALSHLISTSNVLDTAKTTALASTIAALTPVNVYIALGTNDYGLATWAAAAFGTAYADFLDRLHTALPSARIYCQTPLKRGTETANANGSTLDDYRTQITTAVSTRTAYATAVDGKLVLPTLTTTYFNADLIHPNTQGHSDYAAYVAGIVPVATDVASVRSLRQFRNRALVRM